MRPKRSSFSAFSLSFLDIMSCGLGAVILLFLIIKHHTDVQEEQPPYDLSMEIELLEQEILEARNGIMAMALASNEMDASIAKVKQRSSAARAALDAQKQAAKKLLGLISARDIANLKAQIKRVETDKKRVQTQIHERSRHLRTFSGEDNREYLTGIKQGGKRILILLDTSASMLDDTIVNVIRRRNMDDETQRRSWKWQQALAIVEWITARFPKHSRYQIYQFNSGVQAALSNTKNQWLNANDYATLDRAIEQLRLVIPAGGSDLEQALSAVNGLNPRPDNIYLITDGLPTLGSVSNRKSTVSGRARLKLFDKAVLHLSKSIPVNVVLLPMEGDPMAASAFWQIALYTNGSFLTPAKDWP